MGWPKAVGPADDDLEGQEAATPAPTQEPSSPPAPQVIEPAAVPPAPSTPPPPEVAPPAAPKELVVTTSTSSTKKNLTAVAQDRSLNISNSLKPAPGNCVVTGYYWKPFNGIKVKTLTGGMEWCQTLCSQNVDCNRFTYWPGTYDCWEYSEFQEDPNLYLVNASGTECEVTGGNWSCAGDRVLSGPQGCGPEYYDAYADISQAKGPWDASSEPSLWNRSSGEFPELLSTTNSSGAAPPLAPPLAPPQAGPRPQAIDGEAPTIEAVGGDATAIPLSSASEMPLGYVNRTASDVEKCEGMEAQSTSGAAASTCSASPRCKGIYKGAYQWEYVCSGAETWSSCCAEECRAELGKTESYCVESIFTKQAPAGYIRGDIQTAVDYPDLTVPEGSSEEDALEKCASDDDCIGVYQGKQSGTWGFFRRADEGKIGSSFIECCSPDCRIAQEPKLGIEYCKAPIFQKEVAVQAAGGGGGVLSGLWPFQWWAWLVLAALVAIVSVLVFMKPRSSGARDSKARPGGSKKKTRNSRLDPSSPTSNDSAYDYHQVGEEPNTAAEPDSARTELTARPSGRTQLPARPSGGTQQTARPSGGPPPDQHIQAAMAIFDALDRDGDGVLTREELAPVMSLTNLASSAGPPSQASYQTYMMQPQVQAQHYPTNRVVPTVMTPLVQQQQLQQQQQQQAYMYLPQQSQGWQPQSCVWPSTATPRPYVPGPMAV